MRDRGRREGRGGQTLIPATMSDSLTLSIPRATSTPHVVNPRHQRKLEIRRTATCHMECTYNVEQGVEGNGMRAPI